MKNIDVVIVGGSANALGILRSLAPFVSCLVLCDDKSLPIFKSRLGKKLLVSNTKSKDIVLTLKELGARFVKPPVLFLSEEKTVEQVSLHRELIQQYYYFELTSHDQIIDLQSKSGFQTLAERHNSPIPNASVIQTLSDIANANLLTFPCVFKPLYQDVSYSKKFKKAYKVASLAEVKELYTLIHPIMPDMMLQEWINGKDSDIYFCLAYFDSNSQLIGDFSGRKLRSWPLNIGGTASCTNAPEKHEELSEMTASFAKAISYSGLIGMEYKFDNKRQRFYMIEPTVGRTDYQHEIATLSGCNLLLQIYLHSKNENLLQFPLNKQAVIWRDEIADANALANGADPVEPFNAKIFYAVKRWNDPWPYLSHLIARIVNRFSYPKL
ncbi:MAG: hypothetical protein MJK12_16665 [Colwellia sp.]|nr:hypothetical protein [Colwellia sp.]